jgi:hypothetical protein
MVKYQFEIDSEEWEQWKETVPRTKALDTRIRELIRADTEGRVRANAEIPSGGMGETERPPASEVQGSVDTSLADEAPPEPDLGEGDDPIDEALDGWRPDSQRERREARREAGRAALEYLREVGVAQKADFVEEVEPDHPVSGQEPDTWWRETVKDAIDLAKEAGLISYHNGTKAYHWGELPDK